MKKLFDKYWFITRWVLITVYGIGAVSMMVLGYDWITLGHGLNPYISFPLAAIMLVVIGVLLVIDLNETDEDVVLYGVFKISNHNPDPRRRGDPLECLVPADFPCGYKFETMEHAIQAIRMFRDKGDEHIILEGIKHYEG